MLKGRTGYRLASENTANLLKCCSSSLRTPQATSLQKKGKPDKLLLDGCVCSTRYSIMHSDDEGDIHMDVQCEGALRPLSRKN